MKAFKTISSLMLTGALLGFSGCATSTYVRKGADVKTDTVKIKDCTADPDTALVPKGKNLTWVVDPLESPPHTYTVQFQGKKPIASSTAPTGQAQQVNGDLSCTVFGGISASACLFPYNLIQDGTKKCPDPGVHVVP